MLWFLRDNIVSLLSFISIPSGCNIKKCLVLFKCFFKTNKIIKRIKTIATPRRNRNKSFDSNECIHRASALGIGIILDNIAIPSKECFCKLIMGIIPLMFFEF